MGELSNALYQLRGLARDGLGVVLFAGAALALVAWLERSRRINAFGPLARLARSVADPLLRPVERVMVRFGRPRVEAPWWGLLALLVLSATLVGLIGYLAAIVGSVHVASVRGPRGFLRLGASTAFIVLEVALIARVVMSWVGGTYTRLGRLATTLTEWMLAPLRRVLPRIGVVDISPVVAWFGLSLLSGLVLRAL